MRLNTQMTLAEVIGDVQDAVGWGGMTRADALGVIAGFGGVSVTEAARMFDESPARPREGWVPQIVHDAP
jgi:hypothetical protein